MKLIEGLKTDTERALYGIKDTKIVKCTFEGPADGESALKETSDIEAEDCDFRLRYPLWHSHNAKISDCRFSDTSRAAVWYCNNFTADNCDFYGIKVLRECVGVHIGNSRFVSPEMCWMCRDVTLTDCEITSEYPFLCTKDLKLSKVTMTGKYSFQYTENVLIENSILNTKDAFWHSRNVTVKNSTVSGEYLGWYSENLTLIDCVIKGTQPLCYADNLTLINCEMSDCDLSFEKSTVNVKVNGNIDGVKNPHGGTIEADSIGLITMTEPPVSSLRIIQRKPSENNPEIVIKKSDK